MLGGSGDKTACACAGCARSGLFGAVGGRAGQASVNPKAETVEELKQRRKNLHLGMMKLAREDLALKLQAAHDAFVVCALSPPPAPPGPPPPTLPPSLL